MNHPVYQYSNESPTIFNIDSAGGLQLLRLFGMPCVADSKSPWIKGLLSLDTDKGTLLFDRKNQCHAEKLSDGIGVTYTDASAGLILTSSWTFCNDTGIWRRKDSIENISRENIIIHRCLSRFSFAPGQYELYSQGSRWCHENQGAWQKLLHGSIVLGCEGGRTTQGSTPYLCIKDSQHGNGAVFHVIPKGNWVIKASLRTAPGDSIPVAVVELGLSDEHLRLCLKPGQTVTLPEILVQELFNGQPERSAPRLHQNLLKQNKNSRQPELPVVYNTWFDAFADLKTPRLERQLAAAKEIGCEVFTVDAGWYGQPDGDWYNQSGDWREKQNGAFYGSMKDFSRTVRDAGLGFGLWMEPERLCPDVPIIKQHPDWFVDAKNGYYYPDLLNEKTCDYMRTEIIRLIDTYQLAWMKLDFNFDLGIDPTGAEFLWYYEAWYGIIEDIRQLRPALFVESCASGAMRLELASLSHCDSNFLSDTVYPPDMLRIFESCLLRLLPGHLSKWAVLRSAGNTVPVYGTEIEDSPETLLVPCGATWEVSQTANIDFAVFAAMPGVMGFSGDTAGLSLASQSRLKELVGFYKQHRRGLYNSAADLLTPFTDTAEQSRWQVIQMMPCDDSEAVIFAYRLNDASGEYTAKPLGLDKSQLYHVEFWDKKEVFKAVTGESLMSDGIPIEIPERYHATAVVIKR